MRSGSRKVIQQEVEFSHGSAHKEGGVRGHGELSLVRSGLLWTSAFPAKGKETFRFNKMHQVWHTTGSHCSFLKGIMATNSHIR